MLKVQYTLEAGAISPVYSSDGAIGLDLFACIVNNTGDDYVRLFPGDRKAVSTGIRVAIPATHYGRVAPRSGLAFKNGLDVLAGVIDPDYRGVIAAILINLGGDAIHINHGDRIAQLIFERADRADVVQVGSLDDTRRGVGGFGSTGRR